jgi:acyltransferase
MNKRIGWIDIAKGITILLVIVGHTLIGYKVNDYIYAFHMPLFFICSGLLFKPK